MGRWLLVGALWAETLPVARRLEGAEALGLRLLRGRLAGREVALLTCGVGPQRAADRTAAALARLGADRVLSFGTCGALGEGLPDGTVLTVEVVGREGLAPRAVEPLPGLRAARLRTVSRVVADPLERARLAAQGYEICEMEAAGVLSAAGERPFSALKVVSDQAGQDASPVFVGRLPSPLRVARFQVRAARLVGSSLLPTLLTILDDPRLGP